MAIPHPERDAIDSILRFLCLATGRFLRRGGGRYYVDGSEVYLLGVSHPQHAETQRERVAVFGTERSEKITPLTEEDFGAPVAVLIRPTTPEEVRGSGGPRVEVVLLRVVDSANHTVIFEATDTVEYYNPI